MGKRTQTEHYMLRELRKFLANPKRWVRFSNLGLCGNLSEPNGTIDVYTEMGMYAKGWEHHSGCPVYPVPDGIVAGEYGAFIGRNLELRISLAEHIIKRIETETTD